MSRKREASAGTPATTALTRAGVAFEVHPYEHDPAAASYGLEAAAALGVPAGQVYKTLLVDSGTGLAVGLVPVDRQLDLKAVAGALGWKRAALADPAAAERSSGYVVGGISPVGQRRQLPTVVDAGASAFDRVYVSGGRRGLDISLAVEDLVRVTGASLAEIAR